MAHEKVYGVCENKCFVETMSKEQIENELIDIKSKGEFGNNFKRYYFERSKEDVIIDNTSTTKRITVSIPYSDLEITSKNNLFISGKMIVLNNYIYNNFADYECFLGTSYRFGIYDDSQTVGMAVYFRDLNFFVNNTTGNTIKFYVDVYKITE